MNKSIEKKTIFIILFVLLLNVSNSIAQNYVYDKTIGNFNDATEFTINSKGIIYILDNITSEIIALDTLGNELNHTGGFGWTESTFDYPIDIFATSLNVYVADKNNHRIQRFDNDLNFISELSKRNSSNDNERFGYPLSSATSGLGELFLIDSENDRILKFDTFGNFILNFGGYNYGRFSLKNPTKLAIAENNDVYVLDANSLIVFDQYGNGENKLQIDSLISNIKIVNNNMTLNTSRDIYYLNLDFPNSFLTKLFLFGDSLFDSIKSSFIFKNKLYVLTNKEIHIFSTSN